METSNRKTNSGNHTNKTIRSLKKQKPNQKQSSPPGKAKGGRTTISPPAKIIHPGNPGVQPLASNIDALVLSIDVAWEDSYFFSLLTEAKMLGQQKKREYPVDFDTKGLLGQNYIFNVKEFGGGGYEWIILNHEYLLSIGNWEAPISRPSVLITIRSETLWRLGPIEAVNFILNFIKNQGGIVSNIKITRIDLCVDALFPAWLWDKGIRPYIVTRASYVSPHYEHKHLTGLTIGKGATSARLYDKPLEIKKQSNKTWLYDFWRIEKLPENYKVIRTEFQLRREIIKQVGLNDLDSLSKNLNSVWAYCTKKWLMFKDRPGKQSRQRKILPWWEEIQNGFNGIPSGYPAIRLKPPKAEKEKIYQQIIGYFSTYAALISETTDYFNFVPFELRSVMELFYKAVIDDEISELEFKERVEAKKAQFQRLGIKTNNGLAIRKILGLE